MSVLRRSHDHHRDLRTDPRCQSAAIPGLRQQDEDVMTANHLSPPRLIPTDNGVPRRMAGFARLRPTARTAYPSTPKSPALQRPRRGMHGTSQPRSHPNRIIPNRQAHQGGHCRPGETVKSP